MEWLGYTPLFLHTQISDNYCRMEWVKVELAFFNRTSLNGTVITEYFLFQGFIQLLNKKFAEEIERKHSTVEQLKEWIIELGEKVPADFVLDSPVDIKESMGFYVKISNKQANAGLMAAVFTCNYGIYVRGYAKYNKKFASLKTIDFSNVNWKKKNFFFNIYLTLFSCLFPFLFR